MTAISLYRPFGILHPSIFAKSSALKWVYRARSKLKCNTFGPRRLEVEYGQQVSAVEHG
ncbi:hypothetical protein JKG47_21400 [Acidithiobacillus sp. MC6.1]|nr:hypothetical protein [Acidithiobacillus sp. MC6.1]